MLPDYTSRPALIDISQGINIASKLGLHKASFPRSPCLSKISDLSSRSASLFTGSSKLSDKQYKFRSLSSKQHLHRSPYSQLHYKQIKQTRFDKFTHSAILRTTTSAKQSMLRLSTTDTKLSNPKHDLFSNHDFTFCSRSRMPADKHLKFKSCSPMQLLSDVQSKAKNWQYLQPHMKQLGQYSAVASDSSVHSAVSQRLSRFDPMLYGTFDHSSPFSSEIGK